MERKENTIFSWYTDAMAEEEDQPFDKVIFLDIDGVLNCEETAFETGNKIDKERIELLKYIVDETNADIILSSSWKIGYKNYIDAGYQSKNMDFGIFHDAMSEAGLSVKGITPISQESGPDARPLEIREWLNRFYEVSAYVILDDDTFWSWGFLQRNVVTTITEHPENPASHRYVSGMTKEHAEKAIRILNDVGALKRWG